MDSLLKAFARNQHAFLIVAIKLSFCLSDFFFRSIDGHSRFPLHGYVTVDKSEENGQIQDCKAGMLCRNRSLLFSVLFVNNLFCL
jgi:hypothetical protein